MWSNWDPARYHSDLAQIAALGATSVRIIVPADEFGFPEPAETGGALRPDPGLRRRQPGSVWLDDVGFDWVEIPLSAGRRRGSRP